VNETRSTCCYCGTGCGVVIQSQGDRITGVAGDPDHPSSRGKLCSKGTTLHLTMTPAAMAGRARHPEMREARGAKRERVSWDAALDFVADRFNRCIAEHGPGSVAFYVSGQLLTEDYYAFNKLAKGLIGTSNIDTNSRLCMSSAVTGYTKTLGVDAPPNCYDDIEHAKCFFIAGSNTAVAHPVLFRRIEAARERDPAVKMIVVDPRRTETAQAADLHLAILPGTDVALFHGMLHVMLWEKLVDEGYIRDHTDGFEALRDIVREMSPQAAAEICGVRAEHIVEAAREFAASTAALSLYCQGLNQSTSGTAKNAALVSLHLACGQIGRPGAGPFSLTGQPNAMGGREAGGLATSLAAHRDLANPTHRAEMERIWDVDRVPSEAGLTAVEMFDAVSAGKVKIIWIACTNPAQSMPDVARVRAALEKAELVILQEAYCDTETAPFADVLLPAASWGEKEGTVTNSERRISRTRAAVPAPGEARADWDIACDFARRLQKISTMQPRARFGFTCAEEIWNEHRECTRGRDLDITGLTYATLDREGPQQWPYPEGATTGKARLYEDGVFETPNRRARFHAERYKSVAEPVDARFPMGLTTGRLRDQWHGMSRTGTVASLFGHVPEPRLSLNAMDMARRGLHEGDLVRIESRRGVVHVIAHEDETVRSGQAWLPMHWGKRYLGGRTSDGTNSLTAGAFDPHSRQPELKHVAVKVRASELSWRLTAFAEVPEGRLASVLAELQSIQPVVTFCSIVPMGRDRPGILVRAGNEGAPAQWAIDTVDSLLGLDAARVLRYDDLARGHARRILIEDDRLRAVRLSGEADAITGGEWLRDWLVAARPVADVRRLLLSPATRAPSGFIPGGRVVCQCWNVSEPDILSALAECSGAPRDRLAQLGSRLKCGTNCGSCLPELRELVSKSLRASSPDSQAA
jgi:assimilatory nitrate reductase catalytic subunit